jgi:hypothetical protein
VHRDPELLGDVSSLHHLDLMLYSLMPSRVGSLSAHVNARHESLACSYRFQWVAQDTLVRCDWEWIDRWLIKGLPQNCLVELPGVRVGGCDV